MGEGRGGGALVPKGGILVVFYKLSSNTLNIHFAKAYSRGILIGFTVIICFQLRKIRIPIVSDTECDRFSNWSHRLWIMNQDGWYFLSWFYRLWYGIRITDTSVQCIFLGMYFTTTSHPCKTYSHSPTARWKAFEIDLKQKVFTKSSESCALATARWKAFEINLTQTNHKLSARWDTFEI